MLPPSGPILELSSSVEDFEEEGVVGRGWDVGTLRTDPSPKRSRAKGDDTVVAVVVAIVRPRSLRKDRGRVDRPSPPVSGARSSTVGRLSRVAGRDSSNRNPPLVGR